ncbi:MAG: hypothetical protein H0T79_20320 [Deltaproteobacteria bacterium]|nr:hypothetical protein [Deltaproteobacteria bacterium]
MTTQLRSHQYCHENAGPPTRSESYPRCERVGPEWGESWVVAIFDNDTLVELRRWERFTDDNKAVERWNKLVADRNAITPESAEALQALRTSGLLQPGTRIVKAFRDGDSLVGVYLLTPTAPEDASVLEKIIRLPRK